MRPALERRLSHLEARRPAQPLARFTFAELNAARSALRDEPFDAELAGAVADILATLSGGGSADTPRTVGNGATAADGAQAGRAKLAMDELRPIAQDAKRAE